ncbi:MAG: ATP-binding protein [Planctomycetota bacterium]
MPESAKRQRFSRLLIIEDDQSQLRTLTDLAKGEGLDVTGCSTATEALDHFQREEFGVVILDLRLPDLDGTQLLKKLSAMDAKVRVIINTGHGSFDSAKEAVNLGAFAYVEKAGDPNELIRHLRAASRWHFDHYAKELEEAVAERTKELCENRDRLKAGITERKRAEQALRGAENRYRALFEHTPCSVWAVDPADGNFLDFNEAAHRSLGYTRAEFCHLTIPDIESRETPDQVAAHIQRVMETGYDEFESEHKTKSGEIRDVFVRVRRLELDDRAYLQAIILDITERRRAEEEARRHQAELAQVARMSTMGEMASGLAHELNQPLTAVVNYAQGALRRLRSGGGADEEVLNALEGATEQAHRAAEIIRRLADFVQKREPRRSTRNFNDAVREVVSFLEADAREHGVRIDLDLSVDLPDILMDNIQIQQVILNLVRNGIEAMSEMTVAERVLGIRTSVAGDALEVAVRDRGPGLTPEVQERIFTPFYTTKPRGMGMGLSVSRSIIDAHGGRLWAACNPDRGTTFHFTLPFSAGAPDDERRSDRLRRG